MLVNHEMVELSIFSLSFTKKFENKRLLCICKNLVSFEIIAEIQCGWDSHAVIQSIRCGFLCPVDKQCFEFQSILDLMLFNSELILAEPLKID